MVIVEDNETFRQTLELLFGFRDEIEVVASVATGDEAPPVVRALRPDVVLMDYRMPGLNGAEATRLVLRSRSDDPRRLFERLGDRRGDRRGQQAGAAAVVTKDEDFDRLVGDRVRGCARVKLTVDNTAVVLDSTADFPDAPTRFPNFRIVPLYVRFGDESFRDYVDITAERFYERLQTDPELPTTSQPTPGDFLATFEELRDGMSGSCRSRSHRRSPARLRAPRRLQRCSAEKRCA